MALPFDRRRLEASGAAFPVASQVWGGLFSAASNGNLVYRLGGETMVQLGWVGRDGQRLGTVGAPGPYQQIALSPSGHRVAIQREDPTPYITQSGDLWMMDLSTGVLSRLTSDPAYDSDPAWSPDERHLAFTSTRTGRSGLYRKDLVTGAEEPLADIAEPVAVDEWTPDGRFVIFRNFGRGVHALPMSGDRIPKLLVDTPYTEDQSHVSPDGRWIAFNSDESGRWEVYVAAFPDFSSKRQISNDGGVQPLWRRDGRELFYLSPQGNVMSVEIRPAPTLQLVRPRGLFKTNLRPVPWVSEYGAAPDGRRFLIPEPVGRTEQKIIFLLNWAPGR